MTDYSNQIGRFNSFGNGFGNISGVTIGRYNLLTKQNIILVGSKLKCLTKYINLSFENTIWVNYQPSCANQIIKGAGRMINGIYKKIGDVHMSDTIHEGVKYINIQFNVKRLDIYEPFNFKINDKNNKYNWQSLRKDVPDASLHTIGSLGKITQKNACNDVINHIRLNYAIKIQRWFRNIHKSSTKQTSTKPKMATTNTTTSIAPVPQISQAQLLAILQQQPDLLAGIGATINQAAENKQTELEKWKTINNWVAPDLVKQQLTDLINTPPPKTLKEMGAHLKQITKLYNHENPTIPENLLPTKSAGSKGKARSEKLAERYAKCAANDHRNLYCKNNTHNKNGESPVAKIKGKCNYVCRSEATLKKHEKDCPHN